MSVFYFFLTHTATSEIYTLSLHDALPICLPVDDVGAHAARVVEEPHRVRRARHRGHALRGDEASHETMRALVAQQEVPVAVHHQGREGLLLAQGEVERALDVGHLGRVERGLPV